MENVGIIETGVLAGMIMTFVQLIVWFVPNIDKRWTTLGVSVVLSILSIISIESVGIIEAILAVLVQVFAYDFALQPVQKSMKSNNSGMKLR